MSWDFDGSRPIYAQLVERLQGLIVSGEYPPGMRVPPVRELAAQAGVNPNTLQRAFSELERQGLLRTERTAGRFVTEDETLLLQLRARLAEELTDRYLAQLAQLKYTPNQAQALIEQRREQNG